MLGILFIYFIGKYFYDLAIFHNKSKWSFAILGIISYYAGTLLGGFFLGLFSVLFSIEIDWDNNILISVLAIPFGVGTTYLVYFLLKRKWNSEVKNVDTIDSIGEKQEQNLN